MKVQYPLTARIGVSAETRGVLLLFDAETERELNIGIEDADAAIKIGRDLVAYGERLKHEKTLMGTPIERLARA